MTSTLIGPENAFAILAIFFCISAIGVFAERTNIGKRLSAPIFVIILSLILANLRVIPPSAPVYDLIWTYLVPFAIALFLIKANLFSIVTEGGRVLIAFAFGAIGAALGALIGALVLDLGDDAASLAAVFSATYTGGSLNFAAVAEAIGFQDPTKLATAVAIDNVVGIGFIIGVGMLASWSAFQRRFHWHADSIHEASSVNAKETERPAGLADLTVSLGLGAAACAAGIALATYLGWGNYAILFITVIMVAVATLGGKVLARLRGEDVIAMAFMYLFFAILGTGADVGAMIEAAPAQFWLVISIFVFHTIFILLGAYLFKLNYGEIIVASLACIGGPPIASALAILFGWNRLAVPGIVTGVFGYVVGNFIGIGIFNLLS